MDSVIQFGIPTDAELDALAEVTNNYTELLNEITKRIHERTAANEGNLLDNYGTLTVTIWIIIVLIFCLATLVFCVCSCLFYSKIHRWNRDERIRHQQEQFEDKYRDDILPSYSLVSGLPSYDAALEQYNRSKNGHLIDASNERPSVFQIFRYENEKIKNITNGMDSKKALPVPAYEDVEVLKQPFEGDMKNERLCFFITRLQSQISSDSTSSFISEKSNAEKST